MKLLGKQAPAEADNFRCTVLLAIAAAQVHPDKPGTASAEMARKVTAALDAAGVATADGRPSSAPPASTSPDRTHTDRAVLRSFGPGNRPGPGLPTDTADITLDKLVQVASSRWAFEERSRTAKQECGLDDYQDSSQLIHLLAGSVLGAR